MSAPFRYRDTGAGWCDRGAWRCYCTILGDKSNEIDKRRLYLPRRVHRTCLGRRAESTRDVCTSARGEGDASDRNRRKPGLCALAHREQTVGSHGHGYRAGGVRPVGRTGDAGVRLRLARLEHRQDDRSRRGIRSTSSHHGTRGAVSMDVGTRSWLCCDSGRSSSSEVCRAHEDAQAGVLELDRVTVMEQEPPESPIWVD